MAKIGDTKQEKDGDDTLVWKLVKIEGKSAMTELKDRIKLIEKELETIEDFDDEMVAQAAIFEEKQMRRQMKADMKAEIIRLKEKVGD